MNSRRPLAEKTLRLFLARASITAEFEDGTPIHAEGLGLDSLETAELSALLEDQLGTDPFSQGQLPVTVGELLDFYGDSASVPS